MQKLGNFRPRLQSRQDVMLPNGTETGLGAERLIGADRSHSGHGSGSLRRADASGPGAPCAIPRVSRLDTRRRRGVYVVSGRTHNSPTARLRSQQVSTSSGRSTDTVNRFLCVLWTPNEKHFRTINVQWLGNGAFLAVVAGPRISNVTCCQHSD